MPGGKAIKPEHQLSTHSWFVFHLRFSPRQNLLAVGAHKQRGVIVIDTATWTIVRELPAFTWAPSFLEFSPDGQSLLASEGRVEPTFCWNVSDGAVKWSLPKKTGAACFSPDGSMVVGGRAKALLIFDAATGKTLHQLDGHASGLQVAAFTPDGRRILSIGKSQAFLWDAKTAKLVRVLQEKSGQILNFAFSSTGLIALGTQKGGVVRFYDAHSGDSQPGEIAAHESGTFYLDFTPDGKFIVTSGIESAVHIWDVANRRLVRTLEFDRKPESPSYKLSPDGKFVAVCLGFQVYAVHIYEVSTGTLLAVLAIEGFVDPKALLKVPTAPQEAAFSPDGNWLAIACTDGSTRIWSMKHVLKAK